MRRRPQIFGTSPTGRAEPPVGASPGAGSNWFALFRNRDFSLHGKDGCNAEPVGIPESHELLHRVLQGVIDQVTTRFEEAQSEYRLLTANSRDWHKWKGQMIAYANVVALLEDLKSRPVPAE